VELALTILVTVFTVLSAAAMFALFVWGAKKDGEDEREFRRRTREVHRGGGAPPRGGS
jgi:hypothetical protein